LSTSNLLIFPGIDLADLTNRVAKDKSGELPKDLKG